MLVQASALLLRFFWWLGVHMHSCRRILFICTVQSLYDMRVYYRCFFKTSMRVWWGIGSEGVFPLVHGLRLLLAWEAMF